MALPILTDTVDAAEAMQDAFVAFWATQAVRPPLTYDNVDEDVANNALDIVTSDPEAAGEGYVLIQVLHATGTIAALGTTRFRQIGIMNLAIYVETNEGRRRTAGKIADQALNFFQTSLVAGVTFQNPRINEVGLSGRWWQVNVLSDFLYDINRS